MTALARFGHHEDPVIDFLHEVEEIEALAFERKLGFSPVRNDLEARIRGARDFEPGDDDLSRLAKASLRDLETIFLRHDIMARRRVEAQMDRLSRDFEGGTPWLG